MLLTGELRLMTRDAGQFVQPRPGHDGDLARVLDYENGRISISTAVPPVFSNNC
jgi:hypothetical protein